MATLTIPTSRLFFLRNEIKKNLNKDFINQLVENFKEGKIIATKKINKNFCKTFEPAIIFHYLTYKKLPSKRKTIKELKRLTSKKYKKFLNELQIIFFELR